MAIIGGGKECTTWEESINSSIKQAFISFFNCGLTIGTVGAVLGGAYNFLQVDTAKPTDALALLVLNTIGTGIFSAIGGALFGVLAGAMYGFKNC